VIQLRIKIWVRLVVGMDDQVMLDRWHVRHKVGQPGVVKVHWVMAELADVSREGRAEVGR
jgi:hypothetical protein